MHVHVKIICRSFFEGFSGSTVDAEEGSSIRRIVEKCLSEANIADAEQLFEHIMVMRNNKSAKFEDIAADGDTILVLNKIMGG